MVTMTSKEDVVANLRAIIISSKGGLKLSDIRADYRETFGVDIPLKALGYGSLEDFFKNNSDNFTLYGNTVQAVIKSSSVHIVSLVSRQNSRKKGRSRLTSRQARNLQRSSRCFYEPTTASHNKKYAYNMPPKFFQQNVNKNNLSSALKQMQDMQRMTSTKKTNLNIQKISQKPDELKQESDNKVDVPVQLKNLQEPKSIKCTVINNSIFKDSANSGAQKVMTEGIPFEDFEDLHITVKPQSRLLKIKSHSDKNLIDSSSIFVGDLGESHSPPPASPFRRSLAINTEEEILLAKRTAQICLDTNLGGKKKSPVDLITDVEGNSKYEQTLKQFCTENGLVMPSYSVIVREPLNQAKCYGCKLTIGARFHVSTYPVETHSESTARELASKKAYHLLTLNNNLPSPICETEHVVRLRALCFEKKLPEPIFKSIECHPKNEPGYFICKVRIGENILLSSYPEEVKDEQSARDLAAQKAFSYLSTKSEPAERISKNDNDTLNQIFNVIKAKEYGVWSNKLPILYMDCYKEELQSNWFELVKNSPSFEITHIERVGHIIRAKSDFEIPDDSVEFPPLASLKVPESNHWEVYITNVVSSCEIWCRLIGKDYSELYDAMMTKFELQPPTIRAQKPTVGEIYLVNLEESWNRVRVLEIFSDKQEASVFLIDIGADEVVKLSQLFFLQKSFFSVPPQAVLLSLNELDCIAECEELQSALFDCLLGNTFIAEVVAILDEGENVSSVNLWDTSTDEDVNVNLKLLDDVIKSIKSPNLPSVGLVREMFVSHVNDSAEVFLQSSKKNAEYVDYIISIKLKNSGKLVPVNKIDPKKLYVTWCSEKGLYYRAKCVKALDSSSVIVRFIDVGCEQNVAMDDLYDLEQTSLDLATIPCQVVRTKMAHLKVINNKVVVKIRECILQENVLVKVTQCLPENTPAVELFKRSHSDGTLSSVNNKINSDEELLVENTPSRKKSYVVGLESTLPKDLPVPNIPPVGSYFNVIVTLAAHPGLFSVQPLSTQTQLMELMFRLQEKCEATFRKPLSQEEFKIGELYAVKHADNYWYRACAHAITSPSDFTVCLCDFGDFVMVPPEKLMPLASEFKTFPYQAIRAYLAGIAPVNKDWSAVDCVKFREMVMEKQFVSQVVEINRDLNNPNYITLGLILVDTTTAEDVYIHQILIEKNIAMLKT